MERDILSFVGQRFVQWKLKMRWKDHLTFLLNVLTHTHEKYWQTNRRRKKGLDEIRIRWTKTFKSMHMHHRVAQFTMIWSLTQVRNRPAHDPHLTSRVWLSYTRWKEDVLYMEYCPYTFFCPVHNFWSAQLNDKGHKSRSYLKQCLSFHSSWPAQDNLMKLHTHL